MIRYTQAEKYEIIRLVEESDLPAKRTLMEVDVPKSTFYDWYRRYLNDGYDGLKDRSIGPKRFWNKIPDEVKQEVVDIALEHTDRSPRELAWFITDTERYYISETSVYRILKAYDLITSPNYIVMTASDKFKHPTRAINELWQTDFTYFKIIGWGWYYLSTVLDDYSRYILSWKLFTSMNATDVQETLDMALEKTNVREVNVRHRPRLLTDNGPCYLSHELKEYLKDNQMNHTRGAPYHPQTQGKIERYHRTMKNVVKLDNYYLPGDLEQQLTKFVDHYNNHRYHESLDNCTPADVYFGRYQQVLSERQKIKYKTLKMRYTQNMGIKSINQVNYHQI